MQSNKGPKPNSDWPDGESKSQRKKREREAMAEAYKKKYAGQPTELQWERGGIPTRFKKQSDLLDPEKRPTTPAVRRAAPYSMLAAAALLGSMPGLPIAETMEYEQHPSLKKKRR